MGIHTFNTNIFKARQIDFCEFEASLIYIEFQASQECETLFQNKTKHAISPKTTNKKARYSGIHLKYWHEAEAGLLKAQG